MRNGASAPLVTSTIYISCNSSLTRNWKTRNEEATTSIAELANHISLLWSFEPTIVMKPNRACSRTFLTRIWASAQFSSSITPGPNRITTITQRLNWNKVRKYTIKCPYLWNTVDAYWQARSPMWSLAFSLLQRAGDITAFIWAQTLSLLTLAQSKDFSVPLV